MADDLALDDPKIQTVTFPSPKVTLTGAIGSSEISVSVEGSENRLPLEVTTADGSRVTIKAGKSKTFIGRNDARFHLLDCGCTTCKEARATQAQKAQ